MRWPFRRPWVDRPGRARSVVSGNVLIGRRQARQSRCEWGLALAVSVACAPLLLLLAVLAMQVARMPVQNRLRVLSVEGTPLYYNPAAPRNPEAYLMERRADFRERRLVADYLLRPLAASSLSRGILIPGALLLDGVLNPPAILDLALLLEEGGLPGPTVTTAGAELEREGFRGEIRSTLSDSMQQSVRSIVSSELQLLREDGAYQAAVVVLERDGDVLRLRAMVDTGGSKGINGALLVRHAGSVLKPFLYALAFERHGWRPRTIIDDTPLHLSGGSELYEPRNHDNKFAGPITVREALASSRNIPAVRTLLRIGAEDYVQFLREAGLEHIGPASRYGPSLALGTGGTTALETAVLFSVLASGGELHPLLLGSDGEPIYLTPAGRPTRQVMATRRMLSLQTTQLITHILSDREARRISFSRRNFLDFPFDVAAKTGTSQSYRDSWTAGYTDRYVVAVWLGNFSGRSMAAVSGLRGAARVFHQVMRLLVDQGRPSFRYPRAWRYEPVCRSTGIAARLSPSGCPAMVEVFLPDESDAASVSAGGGLSTGVSLSRDASLPGGVSIPAERLVQSPFHGQVFYLDPHRPEGQRVPLEFRRSGGFWSLYRNGQAMPEFAGRPLKAGVTLLAIGRGRYMLRVSSGHRGDREATQREILFDVR